MFIEVMYLIYISIFIIIGSIFSEEYIDKEKVKIQKEKIEKLKKFSSNDLYIQNQILDEVDILNNEKGKSKILLICFLPFIIIIMIYLKGYSTLYLLGFKIGFIFITLYSILFYIIYNYIIQRFINK